MTKKLANKSKANQESPISLLNQLQSQANGKITKVSLEISGDLTYEEWTKLGSSLAQVEHATNWWFGDWWVYGAHRYGERKYLTDLNTWTGPSFQASMDAGSVCRSFETSRRREVLSFNHHRAVMSLAQSLADELLNWAEEPLKNGAKAPRSVADLRVRVTEIHAEELLDKQENLVKNVVSSLRSMSSEQGEYNILSKEQDQKPHKKMLPEPDSSLPVVTEQQFTAAKAAAEAEEATKVLCRLQSRLEDTVKVINTVDASKVPVEVWNQQGKVCRQALRVIEKFLDTIEPS
jgi:hypothetical protein